MSEVLQALQNLQRELADTEGSCQSSRDKTDVLLSTNYTLALKSDSLRRQSAALEAEAALSQRALASAIAQCASLEAALAAASAASHAGLASLQASFAAELAALRSSAAPVLPTQAPLQRLEEAARLAQQRSAAALHEARQAAAQEAGTLAGALEAEREAAGERDEVSTQLATAKAQAGAAMASFQALTVSGARSAACCCC